MELPIATWDVIALMYSFYIMMELPTGGMSWLIVYHDGTPSGDVMIMNQAAVFPVNGGNSLWRRPLAAVPMLRTPIPMNNTNYKKNQVRINNQSNPIQRHYRDICDYVILFRLFIPWTDVTFMMFFFFRKTTYFHLWTV